MGHEVNSELIESDKGAISNSVDTEPKQGPLMNLKRQWPRKATCDIVCYHGSARLEIARMSMQAEKRKGDIVGHRRRSERRSIRNQSFGLRSQPFRECFPNIIGRPKSSNF